MKNTFNFQKISEMTLDEKKERYLYLHRTVTASKLKNFFQLKRLQEEIQEVQAKFNQKGIGKTYDVKGQPMNLAQFN